LSRPDPSSVLFALPPGAEILIIRIRSLGDVIMLTPALAALHAWRPDLRISVLVAPAFASVLEGHPAVAEVIPMRGFLSTARALRRRRFAVTYNQHGGPTSAFLTFAAGSPVRVCWARLRFQFFYNVRVPDPAAFFGRAAIHTVEDRIAHFYFTGLPRVPIPPARVFPQPDAVAAVRKALSEHGISPGQPYAVLRPGAASPDKQWPIERFVELARWLHQSRGLPSVIDLGPGEDKLGFVLMAQAVPPCIAVASTAPADAGIEIPTLKHLGVRELIALIAGARLFVGNDTGPTHIAAAVGCPTVAVFAATDPLIWGPWRVAHRVVEAEALCDTCPPGRCYASGRRRCILSVSTSRVQRACSELLDSAPPRDTALFGKDLLE
jgi:ADP-heptose:LPS heptosyltransferase